ncbi:MAG TPA: DUF5715 family protein [Terriglobales bacterium]|jgi:hypothetical protein|nr:DUF5715 family protein [Terriglobales bacterium]
MRIQKYAISFFVTLVLSCQAFAVRPMVSPRYHRMHRIHRIPWNPLFKPSHESLLLQNEEIDRLNLPRIYDDRQLEKLKASGDLVPIVPGQTLRIQPSLDPNRRYCRTWTLDFVNDLSEAYYKEFHEQIQVNSAVRTVLVQKKLRRHNRNAAPERGETASSHLAGLTVDLQRRGMTKAQVKWMENYLRPLKEMGLVEPEEERRQWCFHIMVAGAYDDWRATRMFAAEEDVNKALSELTTVGLPEVDVP